MTDSGVRCQYCHFGGDGISFEGVEFDSDEKGTRRRARYTLEMAGEINKTLLAGLPERRTFAWSAARVIVAFRAPAWVINDLAGEYGASGEPAIGVALLRMNAENNENNRCGSGSAIWRCRPSARKLRDLGAVP